MSREKQRKRNFAGCKSLFNIQDMLPMQHLKLPSISTIPNIQNSIYFTRPMCTEGSDCPTFQIYQTIWKEIKVVAFSSHHKWDEYVFEQYSIKGIADGFIFGFDPEFGDVQYIIREGMP